MTRKTNTVNSKKKREASSTWHGGPSRLANLWLKARDLVVNQKIETVSEFLTHLDKVVDRDLELEKSLTAGEAQRLRSDLILSLVIKDPRDREKIMDRNHFRLQDLLTEDGEKRLKKIVIDSEAISKEEVYAISERIASIRNRAEQDPLNLNTPLRQHAKLNSLLFPKPLDEALIRLNISPTISAKLKKHIHNLLELQDQDTEKIARTTGISQEIISDLQKLAKELLFTKEIFLAENDRANFGKALLRLNMPEDAVDALELEGIDSFAEARRKGNDFTSLGSIPSDLANRFTAYTRLAAVSPEIDVNTRLFNAGIKSVLELAQKDEGHLARILESDTETVHPLLERSHIYRGHLRTTIADLAVISATGNKGHELYSIKSMPSLLARSFLRPPDPDICKVCGPCESALSPLAYLIDLIDFVMDTFMIYDPSIPSFATRKAFPDLQALEDRFRRPFRDLLINCEAIEHKVLQIEIAIEVLERFLTTPPLSGSSRELLYSLFNYNFPRPSKFPKPNILSDMFDAYLRELGVMRNDFNDAIQAAYPSPSSSTQPDSTKLDDLIGLLGISKIEFTNGLGLKADWEPHIKALDWLPELVKKAKAKGLDPSRIEQLSAYQDSLAQAEASIRRVKEYALPSIRDNLIYYALFSLSRRDTGLPIKTAKQLGNYLHIDLSIGVCAMTTRVADVIGAIQSFVFAFELGYEDSLYPGWSDFDPARWRWLQNYSLWQAVQMVFLYSENFLFPNLRTDKTNQFEEFLKKLESGGATLEESIREAVNTYKSNVLANYAGINLYAHPSPEIAGFGLDSFYNLQKNDYAGIPPDDLRHLILDEWYFFIPLAVASALNKAKHYTNAMKWYHNVLFPYKVWQASLATPFPPKRLVWAGFAESRDAGYAFRNTVEWMRDPFAPFRIAQTRQGAFLRHVICQYVENLLDWADAEFIRDTNESINRARELYELAEHILQTDDIPQEDRCLAAWSELMGIIYSSYSMEQASLLLLLIEPLQRMNGRLKLTDISAINEILVHSKEDDETFEVRLGKVKGLADQIKKRPTPKNTLADIKRQQEECQIRELVLEDAVNMYDDLDVLLTDETVDHVLSPETKISESTSQKIGCGFCVPPNPLLDTMRYRVEVNLEKIRSCRNFAGMRRSIQTYATAVDPASAVQQAAAGENIEDIIPSDPPSVYRFSYLVERARFYVQVAQQLESLLLHSFERLDAEKYDLLRARQDLKASQANLALHALHVKDANDEITLARLQQGRARIQLDHFTKLLNQGYSAYEREAIGNLWVAHDWQIAATAMGGVGAIGGAIVGAIFGSLGGPPGSTAGAILGGIAGAIAGGGQVARDISSVYSLASQARSLEASYQRRQQEWELQQGLAAQDMTIGEQGVLLANNRLDIAEKEKDIAQLQDQFASAVVNFLTSKFTSTDLWDWMGQVLRRYYREHLNFATMVARMAERTLSFERQESLVFIAPYYAEREKKDLLSAEQLLTDINRLDQHRLTTEKRHKEVTKVISLSSLAPIEFQQLRREGWMEFVTLMNWFDRDFPGEYMRLIKSVSLTVIGLIPPGESIRAKLSSNGLSRVMVGPPFDQSRIIQRQPESISVSTASNGTGLFELRLNDPILLPFEMNGVESTWTLEMPKGANRFDYDTLVDVLLIIRYTALEDSGYQEKVLKQMGITDDQTVSVDGMTSFNFRTSYPDEWYHLNNPIFLADQTQYGFEFGKTYPPYQVQFDIRQGDLSPNEVDHKMVRLNIVFRQDMPVKLPVEIEFRPHGSTDLYAVDADYSWDPSNTSSAPISFTSFRYRRNVSSTTWQEAVTPVTMLKPFGYWRFKIKNGGTKLDGQPIILTGPNTKYPGLLSTESPIHNQNRLDLSWLKDALFIVTYRAKVEYRYAK